MDAHRNRADGLHYRAEPAHDVSKVSTQRTATSETLRTPFTRSSLMLLAIALTLCACGGGGGIASPTAVDPTVTADAIVAESLDDGFAVTLAPAQGRVQAVADGATQLNTRPAQNGRVLVDVPAGTLESGMHHITVTRGGVVVAEVEVYVTPQPRIEASSPDTLDRDGLVDFELEGTGFVAPLQVEVRRTNGSTLVPPTTAEVTDQGTRVVCRGMRLPEDAFDSEADIDVISADGQRARQRRRVQIRRRYRRIDGVLEDAVNPDTGAAGRALRRMALADYADGVGSPAGENRLSTRAISTALCDEPDSITAASGATDYLWQWGQFLDHDIDLTPEATPAEVIEIQIPLGDPYFDPFSTGTQVLEMHRSAYVTGSAPREQINAITAWIDASNVYGSDDARARALRTLDGTGRMKTSTGDLLPFNTEGLDNAGGPAATLFMAGDIRANEQVGLICMHTLFVREHNRLADRIRSDNPELDGDTVYEEARRVVAAQMQVITFREFLPLLLGRNALPSYSGYQSGLEAGIANEFSTAAYRFGHTLLSGTLVRIDAQGNEIAEGHLGLRDAFFSPARVTDEGGIAPVLRGLAAQVCQELDTKLVDDVRNFLFGPPGSGGLDLASLNLMRGREHGLASYNDMRAAMGLARRSSLAEVSSDPEVVARLQVAYESIDDVDLWSGALAEDKLDGAMVGELLRAMLVEQFQRLRDGDPFWYERTFSGDELRDLERTRLSDIIRRNTSIGRELPDDVFRIETDRRIEAGAVEQEVTASR